MTALGSAFCLTAVWTDKAAAELSMHGFTSEFTSEVAVTTEQALSDVAGPKARNSKPADQLTRRARR